MSTKAIQKALAMMDLDYGGIEAARDEALTESEAIRHAAHVISTPMSCTREEWLKTADFMAVLGKEKES